MSEREISKIYTIKAIKNLDKVGKDNHFSILEINQKHMTMSGVFILKKNTQNPVMNLK